MEPQPPSSHPWEGSAQSIQPSWRGQPSLDSEVSLEFGHHAPLLIFPPEGLRQLLSSQRRTVPFPSSRIEILALPPGVWLQRELCHQPFLLC